VDRARPDDHQQPVVLALHDPADRRARLADQRLDRRAGDREEADQVFRRRQGRHIDDPQVVGLAGPLAAGEPPFGAGLCLDHDRDPFVARAGPAKKKPPVIPAVSGVFGASVFMRLPLRPPSGARTKSTQKADGPRHGAQCSTSAESAAPRGSRDATTRDGSVMAEVAE
jgi:hypothetical protein